MRTAKRIIICALAGTFGGVFFACGDSSSTISNEEDFDGISSESEYSSNHSPSSSKENFSSSSQASPDGWNWNTPRDSLLNSDIP